MIARAISPAIAVAVALGFATSTFGAQPVAKTGAGPCPDAVTKNKIEVTVKIVNRVPKPSIDPIDLTNCVKNVKIHWQLDAAASAWQFNNDGIAIRDDYEGQFSGGHSEDDKHAKPGPGNHYYHDNKNSGGKQYKYNIIVYPASGSGKPIRNDPVIINQP